MDLHILSGGAAQGAVKGLQQQFARDTGAQLQGTFGAVGMMKDKLLAGAPCDVAILTAALIDELSAGGHVVPGSRVDLGRVKTGVAVRRGDPLPDVASAEGLRASLLAARGIYFPDPEKATAGIHFVNVLRQLGIHEQVAPFLRPYPNGATAMAHLAQSQEPGMIGCTQVTEIRYTEGVVLVGNLPKEFELATMYSAGVCSKAAQPELARRLVQLLGAESTRALRESGGFEI